MIIITKKLAQQIVDRIMPLVKHNINIMNKQGIILGSGQANRIDNFHKGAMDVIESGAVVEIYPHDLAQYPGSLPGLNCPIVLDEHIIGVVGVSGHPDEVRDTARLVKMVTELILEREIFMEEFRSHKHLLEQFFLQILSEQAPKNFPQIKQQANLMDFHLMLPRLVAVVNVRPVLENAYHNYGVSNFVSSRTQKNIMQIIDESSLITKTDRATLLDNQLVILKHFSADTNPDLFRQWSLRLVELFQTKITGATLQVGLGSLVDSPLELHNSYNEALFALKYCPAGQSIVPIYDFDAMASYLVSEPQARNTCQAFKYLSAKITEKINCKYDLSNTVAHVINSNLNLSSAAKSLYIHRNTLVFRLEKLKNLTGLQPSQYLSHAIICKVLFAA